MYLENVQLMQFFGRRSTKSINRSNSGQESNPTPPASKSNVLSNDIPKTTRINKKGNKVTLQKLTTNLVSRLELQMFIVSDKDSIIFSMLY